MRFLIIINTGAGRSDKNNVLKSINNRIPKDDFQIVEWGKSPDRLEDLVKRESCNYSMVVAVGGDGTVNFVANAILNSNTNIPLAIIPCGSGNGLARFLKIPMNTKRAVDRLYNGKIATIDTCRMNGKLFLSTCGVGFDAKVGYEFSKLKRRGFFSYLKVVLKYYWSYKPKEYRIVINKFLLTYKALLITAANSNQFGNNVIIAPKADMQDGHFNVTIMRPFPWFYAIVMAYRLFRGTVDKSRYVKCYVAKSMAIFQLKQDIVQFDGEPLMKTGDINIDIIPKSLKIVV